MTTCKLCSKPIDTQGRNVRRWVSGWERVRQSGEGIHPLQGRELSNAYAHELCIEIAERGGTQKALAL